MKRLDWYIIKKFIGTYIYSIVLIISISIVFDFNEHMAKFDDPSKIATFSDGGKGAESVRNGKRGGISAENSHLKKGEEPYDQSVQALCTGDDLKDHNFTECRRIFSQKTNTRFTCKSCTFSGTCAAKSYCKAGA